MTDDLDFYDLLGVSEDASPEEIRRGFRQQVREYHPDLNDDPRAPAQFTALKKAYDTLADEKERDAYDRLGHEEYVRKRIDSLPSPEQWDVPDDAPTAPDPSAGSDDRSAGDSAGSGGRSDGSTAESTVGTGPDGDRSTGPSGSTDGVGSTARSNSGSSAGPTSSTPSGGSESTSSASGSTSTSTSTADTGTAGTGSYDVDLDPDSVTWTGDDDSVDLSKKAGRAGVGTARGIGVGEYTDDRYERDDDDEETTDGAEQSAVERVRGRARDGLQAVFGWPLVAAADLLFLVGVALYGAANAAGVERLVAALRGAGAAPGALASALSTRPEGLEPLGAFVAGAPSGSVPGAVPVMVVGMAALPSVYLLLVRWTRKNQLPWQPSYLYVLGASTPVLGLVVSALLSPPGVYVEVLLYVLVPVATMVSMLFFGQLKPRLERLVRRWRYRLRS